MELNRSNLNDLYRGFRLDFQSGFDGATPLWPRIAMEVPSITSENKYPWLGNSTSFREWIGDRVIQNLKSFDWTIRNKPWENTVGVDRDNISDDTYGVYKPLMKQMGQDAKEHPDQLVFECLLAGFAQPCYDGQYFFDTDHPVWNPATEAEYSVSNYGGGASRPWVLLDTKKAIKPWIYQVRQPYKFVAMDQETDEAVFTKKQFRYGVDARSNVGFALWQLAYASKQAFGVDAYAAARAGMMAMRGDHGRPLNIRPDLLLVAPQDEKAALEAVTAERLANGQDNVMRKTAEVVVCPYLA